MIGTIIGIFCLLIVLIVCSIPIILPIILIIFVARNICGNQDNEYHYKPAGIKRCKQREFEKQETPKEIIPYKNVETYDDLLQRKEWKDKRLKILKRDKFQCRYCHSNDNLNIHHKYYSIYPNKLKVEPWNYPDDALITLCENCHHKLHLRKKIKVYYRTYSEQYE